MNTLSLTEFFTVGKNPCITVSVQLALMNPTQMKMWPGIVACSVNADSPAAMLIANAGERSSDVNPVLRFTVDEYSEEAGSAELQDAVDSVQRQNDVLKGELVPVISATMAAKHQIGVFGSDVNIVPFIYDLRRLIAAFKEARLQENAEQVSGLLDVALERSAAASAAKPQVDFGGRYRIETETSIGRLEESVNALYEKGWKCAGGMTTSVESTSHLEESVTRFHQAMTRRKPK